MPPVLIAEHDAVLQTMLHVTLIAAGFDVIRCDDVFAGLAEARIHLPALMLLDMQTPIVNGATAIRILRNSPVTREIPIILMTLDQELPRDLRAILNVAVPAKPFKQDHVLGLVTGRLRPAGVHPRHRHAALNESSYLHEEPPHSASCAYFSEGGPHPLAVVLAP